MYKMEEWGTDNKLLSNTLDEQIAKHTCSSQQKNYRKGYDITKVKEEVEDLAGDDYYTSVSDPLEVDIKDQLENNFIPASAAESYTINVVDPDRDDQEILTAEGHPTSESLTTVPELNNQHGKEITCHDECHQSVTKSKKSHYCSVCHRTFIWLSHLATHERTHTGDKPNVCDVCHKGFSRLHDLVRHERIHTGEKPHVCDVCYKAFSKASNLVQHRRIHTGEKPYVCNVCQKTFNQSSVLVKHKRTHMGDK